MSLRIAMVLVLIVGCVLGWIVHQAGVQSRAVEAILRTGGVVSYDWEWKDGIRVPNEQPRAPEVLVDLLGVDYFGHVFYAKLGSGATDEDMAEVGRLDQLEQLDIQGCNVGDAGLSHLEGLRGLRHLDLFATHVSGQGLVHLRGLTALQFLHLGQTQVSSDGLEHLKGLTDLRTLHLFGSYVGDVGLIHLRGLDNLRRLSLDRSNGPISEGGVEELRRALPRASITYEPRMMR